MAKKAVKKLLHCATQVNKDAVRHEVIDGIEHIIVSSFTLPDDIVMNGTLYGASEIAKSFKSLERTLAPLEHPTAPDGTYISASDPHAINNFYAGAYNTNVEQKDGRVHVEKTINVPEALKTDRGKRLLDRVNEIETAEKPRAMHTSVGVWVTAEVLDEPRVNAAGQSYIEIASDLEFDHDAILLDSVGAAKPSQGVGMAVNAEGNKCKSETFCINNESTEFKIDRARVSLSNMPLRLNNMPFSEIEDGISDALHARYAGHNNPPHVWLRFDAITATDFVYSEDEVLYRSSYSIDENQNITIQDDRIEVKRTVEYKPVSQTTEDSIMRDSIIAKLKDLGITVNSDIPKSELLARYSEALIANNGNDNASVEQLQVNKDLLKANTTLADELKLVKDDLQANRDKEIDGKIKLIKGNSKYAAIPDSALKHMAANEAEEFEKLIADAKPAYGISPTVNFDQGNAEADDAMFSIGGGE